MRSTNVWARVLCCLFLAHAHALLYKKLPARRRGYSLLWPLLLLHCAVDLQHVLYAWSRADVLEQRRSCNGTNTTTSNLNSHITISIGISISRYHLNNRLSYRQRNSVLCISNSKSIRFERISWRSRVSLSHASGIFASLYATPPLGYSVYLICNIHTHMLDVFAGRIMTIKGQAVRLK